MKSKEIAEDPTGDSADYHSIEELNEVISNGNYILWDQEQRDRFEPVREILAEYQVWDYNETRRDDDRPRLRRDEPVLYHDDVRPILIDREDNQWIAETVQGEMTWIPYEIERLDQTGRKYLHPDLGNLYYLDNDWFTEVELASEGRIRKRNIVVYPGTHEKKLRNEVLDREGNWRPVR